MRFETRFTYDFIRRFLPRHCHRVLEVGCGTGELAARLSQDGYAAVAIDSDGESVAAARQLGVDVRLITWPDFEMEILTLSFSLARSTTFIRSIRRSSTLRRA